MVVNEDIYRVACSFHSIAVLAEQHAIEIYSFEDAYDANLAFSIELFLKSLSAASEERVILEVGKAQIKKSFAKSAIKGHCLSIIFSKLSEDIRIKLSDDFNNSRCNVTGLPLDETLELVSSVFVDRRYSFENRSGGPMDSEILLFLSRFFKENLNERITKTVS